MKKIKITAFSAILLMLNSCSGKEVTDYLHNYEFIYNNETSHTLKFEVFSDDLYGYLVVLPQSSNNAEIQYSGAKSMIGVRDPQFVLDKLLFINYSFLDSREKPIFINETSCVEIFESGFLSIENYQIKVINERHIRHTYTFTDADFIDVKPCVE
jgi:hypothetical protein